MLASGSVFFAAAALHLFRVLSGWPLVLGGYEIPSAISVIAVVVAGFLAFQQFKYGSK